MTPVAPRRRGGVSHHIAYKIRLRRIGCTELQHRRHPRNTSKLDDITVIGMLTLSPPQTRSATCQLRSLANMNGYTESWCLRCHPRVLFTSFRKHRMRTRSWQTVGLGAE